MRQAARMFQGVALLSALALAGCGGTTSAPPAPPKLVLKSPAVTAHTMPSKYTCDGRNTWPALEWGAVPANTASLALFVIGYVPEPSTHTTKVSVEWAVAGLKPTLHGLASGHLPREAVVGVDSSGKHGYSVCPEKGSTVQYQFELYGVPAGYGLGSSNFSGVQLASALASSGAGTPGASAYGAFIAKYTRK
jgi:phosphatidylethanolamine-binding protein (PEBP) family uncharacterized protein